MKRIKNCFEKLKAENRKALVVFITAGDPDLESTKDFLEVIDDSGADIIELALTLGSQRRWKDRLVRALERRNAA